MKEGILVGFDQKIEWLLPWWWTNYSKHNSFPVTFVDFGMSEKARFFCAKRGELIALEFSSEFIQVKEPWNRAHVKWESIYGTSLWESRQSWFKKPLALLKSPYERTIWLDLDCEVLTNLSPLFQRCFSGPDVALAKETEAAILHEKREGQLLEGESLYNSGVIVYKREAPLIQKWAEQSLKCSGEFWGDQQLLSRLIFIHSYEIQELSEIYNWRMSQGFNLHAAIIHWVGSWGKEYIRRFGGLGHEMEKLPKI